MPTDPKLSDALHAIEEIDRQPSRHVSVVIALFAMAAACGVYTFFGLLDWLAWDGISERGALMVMSIAWVLLFPVWILAFLGFMSALDASGFKDLRGLARTRLTSLALSRDELLQLDRAMASRQWQHRRIFMAALRDLRGGSPTG